MSDFEKILQILYFEVEKNKKQWFRGYQFNSKLLESLKQLLQSTREYQSDLFREWEQREGGTLTENIQLKEQQLKEDSEEFRAKMEVRFEQDKIEMLAGLEAKRIQNSLGVEIRFERDKAEILADIEAKFEPKINKLFAKLKQQKVSEISDKSIKRKSL